MTRLERVARVLYNRTFRRKALAARISELHLKDDTLTVTVEHPQAVDIAAALVELFRDIGGVNYVAMRFLDPATLDAYECVIQKIGKRTPAQVNDDLDGLLRQVYALPYDQVRVLIDQTYIGWGKVPPKDRSDALV